MREYGVSEFEQGDLKVKFSDPVVIQPTQKLPEKLKIEQDILNQMFVSEFKNIPVEHAVWGGDKP